MGTRYDGPKQLDHVGPGGETLPNNSIYDALGAGFAKVAAGEYPSPASGGAR